MIQYHQDHQDHQQTEDVSLHVEGLHSPHPLTWPLFHDLPQQLRISLSILAIKCLRPQIRSDIDEFTIGAEDLVHETASWPVYAILTLSSYMDGHLVTLPMHSGQMMGTLFSLIS